MHELPITENIIKLAEKHGRESRASQIKTITLVVGQNSGYITESIQMYFDIISKGTMCEGAKLIMKGVKPKIKCPACGEVFERKPMSFACPKCGTDGEPTDIGKEFYIDTIEIVEEE